MGSEMCIRDSFIGSSVSGHLSETIFWTSGFDSLFLDLNPGNGKCIFFRKSDLVLLIISSVFNLLRPVVFVLVIFD